MMTRLSIFTFAALLFNGFYMSATWASNIECELDNVDLRGMSMSLVTFTRPDGSTFDVEVKTADSNSERSAGFQRVCAETVKKAPILFVFAREASPQFHMHNVVAPLDIAFIKSDGGIDSIQSMYPYILISIHKQLYSPTQPVIAALEAHPSFYLQNNIDLQSVVTWVPLP